MKILKSIGTLLLIALILVGIYAAFMNGKNARDSRIAAMNNNERVTVEMIYSEDSKKVFLITVDDEEYLYLQSFSSGAFVKK